MDSGNTEKTTVHLANDNELRLAMSRWRDLWQLQLGYFFVYGSVYSLLAMLINTNAILKLINWFAKWLNWTALYKKSK